MKVAVAVTGGAVSVPLILRVIGTLRGALPADWELIGLSKGFKLLLEGRTEGLVQLTPEILARCESENRSPLFTERLLPRRRSEEWDFLIDVITERHKVEALVLLGGDGTFATANSLWDASNGRLRRILQIPKTMDGDFLDAASCLGYHSATAHGARALIDYERELGSLYGQPAIVRALGRDSGNFALEIGAKASSALILTPEEFAGRTIALKPLIDAIIASQLMTVIASNGSGLPGRFGTAVIAEGVLRCFETGAEKHLGVRRLGEADHCRIDFTQSKFEASIAEWVELGFLELGVRHLGERVSVGNRQIGYLSRAADPTEQDLDLAERFGNHAARLLLNEKPAQVAVALRADGAAVPFSEIIGTGGEAKPPPKREFVARFNAGLKGQRWLRPADLADAALITKLAGRTKLSPQAFVERFSHAAKLLGDRVITT